MARPGSVPVTRLRFRGRTSTLRRMCHAFREHPSQSLTAAEVAEYTDIAFANVHQRLHETPELFVAVPKKKNTNSRFRLTTQLASMGEEETQVFIEEQSRIETWLAVRIVSALLATAAIAGYLGVKY
jgi:hypothetical protein